MTSYAAALMRMGALLSRRDSAADQRLQRQAGAACLLLRVPRWGLAPVGDRVQAVSDFKGDFGLDREG